MLGLAKKIFGSRNDRVVKSLRKRVSQINELEAQMQALSDDELKSKTQEFKSRLEEGATLDSLTDEAFAVVREAAVRELGMRHYDVQLIGAMVLNDGKIAEMRTGEGKTLVATAACYLNALEGKGTHVITVNDYLARRDAAWMGRLYHFLGLTTGVINGSGGMGPDNSSYRVEPGNDGVESGFPGLARCTRAEAYKADITYGTNNEFGFDFLRDNMVMSEDERSQGELHYAIVDEVDSILIDEARTPLIISGPAADTSALYQAVDKIVPKLVRAADEQSEGDFVVDEKAKQVHLTEQGHDNAEQLLVEAQLLAENESLYDPKNITLLHHLGAGLRAHALFQRDVDYMVRGGEIVIVDEFTGRAMAGRRWSDGLHQAIEAKEGVKINQENQTLASITFQNYFRQYKKLSGMTGTADTEAFEFQSIYDLEVIVIPMHKDNARRDLADLVYLTQAEKYQAILADIEDCQKRGQPVLVGTTSIEISEMLSKQLKDIGIDHKVLNAKQHEQEAAIVADAGLPGAVTIATNMAGRGTDIVLGGGIEHELMSIDPSDEAARQAAKSAWEKRHQSVLEAGGLHIVGTERHESRRVDNQLRGRSGRQGDPGSTRFYLSLQDNLMRIFASDRVSGLMQKLGMEEGEAIEHPWVSRAIENAQRKVEAHNFDIRKHLLEYDDVANEQRRVIYKMRDEVILNDDTLDVIEGIVGDVSEEVVGRFLPPGSIDSQWDLNGLDQHLREEFGIQVDAAQWMEEDKSRQIADLVDYVQDAILQVYGAKREMFGDETLRLERFLILSRLDEQWKEHLGALDHLRQGVGFRGYAQKNPKQEYKRESFELFTAMLDSFKVEVVKVLMRIQIQQKPADDGEAAPVAPSEADLAPTPKTPAVPPQGAKIGRNEPCYCGSGKKYKHCHGALS
ncbi:MAG: preprotein translocase subunit SecA [Gammaproteobacteria bacterium]|nr:preprotein translocase subunit SecA [Gammaproteobacteria bacterium]